MKKILIFIMAFTLSEANKTDPGVVGRLTLKGLQYGWQVGLQELQRKLASIRIPDVQGSVSVAVLGRINYDVTELQISSLDFSRSNLTFCPDTGIDASINNGELQIGGRIRIRSSLFFGSSWMELRVQGFSVAGSIGITCDDLGHGAVWNAGCHSSVGRVDLWFQGGSAWIFNMFKGSMIGPVSSAISSQICPSFGEAVKQMEIKLSALPVSLSVDSVSDVEINLVGPPIITSKTFDLLVKAEFVAHSSHLTPYQPGRLVLPDVDSRMLLLAVSQFSANSAAFVHYKAGALKWNVTDDMIPNQSPIRLNMRSLGIFAPQLLSLYPDSPPVLLQLSARSPPEITCKPDSLTVQTSTNMEAFAVRPGQPPISLFLIQADSLTGADPILSEDAVGVAISMEGFSLSLVRSSVGTVKVDTMQKTMSLALKILLPLLNGRLKNILPLPVNMLRLQNPEIRVLQGYIVILTDLQAVLPSPPDEKNVPEHGHLSEEEPFKIFLQ